MVASATKVARVLVQQSRTGSSQDASLLTGASLLHRTTGGKSIFLETDQRSCSSSCVLHYNLYWREI